MKVILNENETKIFGKLIYDITEEEMKSVPGVMDITKSGNETIINIDNEYVEKTYGCLVDYSTTICSLARMLVDICTKAYNALNATEQKYLKSKKMI